MVLGCVDNDDVGGDAVVIGCGSVGGAGAKRHTNTYPQNTIVGLMGKMVKKKMSGKMIQILFGRKVITSYVLDKNIVKKIILCFSEIAEYACQVWSPAYD